MILINKGHSFGWTLEELAAKPDVLGTQLLSVLHCIMQVLETEHHNTDSSDTASPNKKLSAKDIGLVREAYKAMYHDLHGLAVQVDMIKFVFENRHQGVRHKDFLYISEIIEKYFANMRSIYDFMAKVLRLAVDARFVGQLSFDSLNSLIESIEKNRTKGKLPQDLEEVLLSIKDAFKRVRGIRDVILHNGKQMSVMMLDDGYHFADYAESESEDYIPVLPFLKEITLEMITFGDRIAGLIYQEYSNRHGVVPFTWVALEGVCIPAFVEFLGLIEELEEGQEG